MTARQHSHRRRLMTKTVEKTADLLTDQSSSSSQQWHCKSFPFNIIVGLHNKITFMLGVNDIFPQQNLRQHQLRVKVLRSRGS